ncbi:RNA-directed DNA polymerase [Burkholderia multivorans]|uniref:antiviral reverse transcriptase Drt3a n=1 Tax=Burkholderia multivorans TaxID=87883 RepID=UPI001C21F542|nr:antiviral reverse transcriptase Drt3a [Burkholderia multivorans]MBU9146629.1 RNA-directed DNA polymerase [Burkholderia multivorans]
MIDQTFSARNLLRLTTRLDPKKYRLGKNKKDYLSSLEKVSQAALSDEFKFSAFSRSTRAGKTVYTVTNHTDEFIIRKLNDNLSRIYNVKQSNRAEIIGQAIPLLKEKIPFFLLKLDIKDFYETIDRTTLMERIAQDSALAFRSKLLLNQLFATQSHFPGTGIPRGVSLSATLSEIYMKDFDGAARTLDGVYFFARYVDDILIFAHSDPTPIKLALANRLPPGMYFNDTKERLLGFNRNGNCHLYNGEPELSYLGYRLAMSQA